MCLQVDNTGSNVGDAGCASGSTDSNRRPLFLMLSEARYRRIARACRRAFRGSRRVLVMVGDWQACATSLLGRRPRIVAPQPARKGSRRAAMSHLRNPHRQTVRCPTRAGVPLACVHRLREPQRQRGPLWASAPRLVHRGIRSAWAHAGNRDAHQGKEGSGQSRRSRCLPTVRKSRERGKFCRRRVGPRNSACRMQTFLALADCSRPSSRFSKAGANTCV
jgi:hypothetical protein